MCKKQRHRGAVLQHRLISAFIFHCQVSFYILNVKCLTVFCVCVLPGLCLTWLETPKTGFHGTWLTALGLDEDNFDDRLS